MMVHRIGGSLTYRVWVSTPTGRVKRSTGTRNKATAKQFDVMLTELGAKGRRRWDLLQPVVDGTLALSDLFDAWQRRDLDGLAARLSDVDLAPLRKPWLRWIADRATIGDEYLRMVNTLCPEDGPWYRSTLTPERIAEWLNGLPVGASTKRKYAAALASFIKYARQMGKLTTNPMADLDLPKVKQPEVEFLERPEVERLIAGSPQDYADLFALIYGTGAEVTAALAVRRRDVDLSGWMVRMPGTKNYNRDRTVIVAEWARERLADRCRTLMPDALLFPAIDRWQATKTHKLMLEELKLRHLKLHAARNHWATRALRGGWSVEAVARQLGHRDGQMVLRIYGRFIPRRDELARLEERAEVEAVRRVVEG
jgi:integrase